MKCEVCKEDYKRNNFVYCDKCLDSSTRVGSILQDENKQLKDKIHHRNMQIKELKKENNKLICTNCTKKVDQGQCMNCKYWSINA